MIDPDETTEPSREPAPGEHRDDPARGRPDRRGPRGNQDVETIDIERGTDKLERVLGW